MSNNYYPSSTEACLLHSAVAHHHETLSSEEYLDRMLAHLSGVRHPEDESMMILYDPLSMVFHACTEHLDQVKIEDTSTIKNLILHSWFGEMRDVIVQTPLVLGSLELYGIATYIYEGLLCIACMTGRVELLKYFLTLNDYLILLAGSSLRPLQFAIGRTYPDVAIWSILLDNGLYLDQSPGCQFDPTHSPSLAEDGVGIEHDLSSWYIAALSTSLPAIKLVEFLLSRGFVVTEVFFHAALVRMNAEFVRWLLTKCNPKFCTGSALLSAVHNSPQVVDVILDAGIDVNFASGPGCDDPFRRTPGDGTALHEAAEKRRADVVKLLLERGANRLAKNSWGQTAEDVATQQVQGPYSEIVDLIHNFVPSSERYILPPEPEKALVESTPATTSRGKHWKFVERKPDSGLLIDFSEL